MSDEIKLPPHSRDAERSLLGSMLRDPQIIVNIVGTLKADDFYVFGHACVFDAMVSLADKGKEVDVVTVAEWLTKKKKISDAGGAAYLAELWDASPSAGRYKQYADIVRDYSRRRKVIHAATDMQTAAFDFGIEVPELVGNAERSIMAISDIGVEGESVDLQTALIETYHRLDTRRGRGEGEINGVPTGFLDLDTLLCGFQNSELIILGARPSCGKAQPLDAKVLTPRGFVEMGNLKVGDEIIGSSGLPTKITGVYPQGLKEVFRVEMTDGSATECCDEHLWFTQTRNERRRDCEGSVKPLSEIRKTLFRDSASPTHAIPVVDVVQFQKIDAERRLHPYLLGLLLGDGDFSQSSIRFTNPEKDILDRLVSLLPTEDQLTFCDDGLNHRIKHRIRNHGLSETKKAIDYHGLGGCDSYSKFVPPEYLLSSQDDRLDLLRGLIDSDGYIPSGGQGIEFSTSSPQLAKDVSFLVRSMGGIVVQNEKLPTYEYKGEKKTGAVSYRFHIRFNNGVIPVLSAKHLARLSERSRVGHRCISRITPVGKKECQCIRVDAPDHLYVTDDFILTHNTAFGLAIARHVAVDCEMPVLFVSLEQARVEIAERLLCSQGRIDSHALRRGHLSATDEGDLMVAGEMLGRAKMFIDDCPAQDMLRISANARRMKQRHDIKLIIIDYLQLITSSDRRASRQEQVGDTSRRLKQLARELKIPVVALAQVNRGVEDRTDKRPRLADLRESGSIEQDADTVIMLHRPEQYDKSAPEGFVEVIVAKQRNGPTGEAQLMYLKKYMRFENYAHEYRYQTA